MPKHKELAREICESIKTMAANENAISNFEGYLSHHLPVWFEKYANTPGGLASELHTFAHMYD